MNVITVSPITKFDYGNSISYYASESPKVDSIIIVLIRNKEVPALITEVKNVEDLKLKLRKSSFRLKRIDDIQYLKIFTSSFIQASKEAATYHAMSPGTFLNYFLPPLNEGYLNTAEEHFNGDANALVSDKFILESKFSERVQTYKSYVRESFAKKESVVITVPHFSQTLVLAELLATGIEDYIFVFNSSISKKTLAKMWNKALCNEHPVLIIMTPNFISIPRIDIKSYIIEFESGNYKRHISPLFSFKLLIEKLAATTNSKLVYSDTFLSLDLQDQFINGKLLLLEPKERRSKTGSKKRLVDMKAELNKSKATSPIISDYTKDVIKSSIDKNEKTWIIAARKGISSLIVCQDCQHLQTCKECGSPLVLKNYQGKRVFSCIHCNTRKSSLTTCTKCKSWKLHAYGIGIDKVESELRKTFENIEIFQIDSDVTKTPKEAVRTIEAFLSSTNGVLLSTTMAIPYLHSTIDHGIVASFDSFFSIPDYNMGEKVFRYLLNVSEMSKKTFTIQTRMPDNSIFKMAIDGDIDSLIKGELKGRKKFNYPPYSLLINVRRSGNSEIIGKDIAKLARTLKKWDPAVVPRFTNTREANLILKISSDNWPNIELSGILKALPKTFTVDIDSGSIL